MDSTRQAGHVTSKERNTGEHRELQADSGQQGWETPPNKPGPPTGPREGLARAQEAVGPRRRPRRPRPDERVGCAVEAPPRRTPAGGARRASAAGSEEPEAATDVVDRRWDAPRERWLGRGAQESRVGWACGRDGRTRRERNTERERRESPSHLSAGRSDGIHTAVAVYAFAWDAGRDNDLTMINPRLPGTTVRARRKEAARCGGAPPDSDERHGAGSPPQGTSGLGRLGFGLFGCTRQLGAADIRRTRATQRREQLARILLPF